MINFTQGDTAVLNLAATDGNGNPINITGASFSTQIKGVNGTVVTFGNSQHAIINAAMGQFTLSLATTDTAQCGLGYNKDLVTTITQGSTVINFRGPQILNVLPPVPLQ